MTMDKDKLRKLAEAATEGPWKAGEITRGLFRVFAGDRHFLIIKYTNLLDTKKDEPNAAFIAATDPNTVIALLDEVEAKSNDGKIADMALDTCELGKKKPQDLPAISPWISVEDRLPEEEGIYLTKYKGDKRQRLDEKTRIRSYPFGGIFKENWTHKKQSKYSITHWMPIPELPAEKGDK